jgi:hypothetical protein
MAMPIAAPAAAPIAAPAAPPAAPVEEAADTITVPASVLAGKTCKPGDVLSMEVVDVDEEGGAEVKLAGGAGEGGDDEMGAYPMETPDES